MPYLDFLIYEELVLSLIYYISSTFSLLTLKLLMMLFSTGTGLEHVGVVWPNLVCWQAGLQASGSSGLRLDRFNAEL